MEKIETEFEDLKNKERELQMNWQIEQESSKAKDDIIKYQDEKIYDFEVRNKFLKSFKLMQLEFAVGKTEELIL